MASLPPELPRDPETLQAMLIAREAEIERLRQIIKELQRHRFGRRAETLPEDQLLLGLEEAEQVEAAAFAASEETAPAEKDTRARQRRANRGALPPHLPRIEMIVDIEFGLHQLGLDIDEELVVADLADPARRKQPRAAAGAAIEIVNALGFAR